MLRGGLLTKTQLPGLEALKCVASGKPNDGDSDDWPLYTAANTFECRGGTGKNQENAGCSSSHNKKKMSTGVAYCGFDDVPVNDGEVTEFTGTRNNVYTSLNTAVTDVDDQSVNGGSYCAWKDTVAFQDPQGLPTFDAPPRVQIKNRNPSFFPVCAVNALAGKPTCNTRGEGCSSTLDSGDRNHDDCAIAGTANTPTKVPTSSILTVENDAGETLFYVQGSKTSPQDDKYDNCILGDTNINANTVTGSTGKKCIVPDSYCGTEDPTIEDYAQFSPFDYWWFEYQNYNINNDNDNALGTKPIFGTEVSKCPSDETFDASYVCGLINISDCSKYDFCQLQVIDCSSGASACEKCVVSDEVACEESCTCEGTFQCNDVNAKLVTGNICGHLNELNLCSDTVTGFNTCNNIEDASQQCSALTGTLCKDIPSCSNTTCSAVCPRLCSQESSDTCVDINKLQPKNYCPPPDESFIDASCFKSLEYIPQEQPSTVYKAEPTDYLGLWDEDYTACGQATDRCGSTSLDFANALAWQSAACGTQTSVTIDDDGIDPCQLGKLFPDPNGDADVKKCAAMAGLKKNDGVVDWFPVSHTGSCVTDYTGGFYSTSALAFADYCDRA